MLQAAAMNGLIIWMFNIINWFKRVWYWLRHAVNVEGTADTKKAGLFTVNYEDQPYSVRLDQRSLKSVENTYQTDEPVPLRWIPGTGKAMYTGFQSDPGSIRALFILDLISIIALIVFLVGFCIIGTTRVSYPVLAVKLALGSLFCMIIVSIVRRRFKIRSEK